MINKIINVILFLITISFLNGTVVFAEDSHPPAELSGLENDVRQVILVTAGQPSAVDATVELWKKSMEGAEEVWRQERAPVTAVVGRNGLAPAGQKREGDGRTPSGTFAVYRAFGYEEPVKTELEYHPVSAQDFWIDDPSSVWYNQWVNGEIPPVSHEVLRREDNLYKYAIIVEYNTDPVIPGNGSAIFIHVWRAADHPTAGCVAMAEPDLLNILNWLKRDDNPQVIIRTNKKEDEQKGGQTKS